MTQHSSKERRRVLWWGRFGNYGPDYPRNRTLIDCLTRLGWDVISYQPKLSALADVEAGLRRFAGVDLVWVPCFRQRDVAAASRWAQRHGVPLIFDPLISAFDKQVAERQKFPVNSSKAQRLLRWEQEIFAKADWLIADTQAHAAYFTSQHRISSERICVLPVGAEEGLFSPQPRSNGDIKEALFFGTFIGLQGATHIAESVAHYSGPALRLTFLGDGPERAACEAIVAEANNPRVHVAFEEWLPLSELPSRIGASDICLGVFGTGEKTNRVIPNKVYQSLACDRPVITIKAEAYPKALESGASGLLWVAPGDPRGIAQAVSDALSQNPPGGVAAGLARKTYQQHFSNERISDELTRLLSRLAL